MEITSFALEIGTVGLPLYSWLSIIINSITSVSLSLRCQRMYKDNG